jgi:hypothetical protein
VLAWPRPLSGLLAAGCTAANAEQIEGSRRP